MVPLVPILALLGASAAQPEGAVVIEVEERWPAVMLVTTPGGQASNQGSSELMLAAGTELEGRTSLALLSLEQAGIGHEELNQCATESRLACWVERAAQADRPTRRPAFLFVLGAVSVSGDETRFYTMLLNTEQALAVIERSRIAGESASELADQLFTLAVQSEPTPVPVNEPGALSAYFSELFDRDFRAGFERAGYWHTHGSVELVCEDEGLSIELDGLPVGQTSSGVTRLEGLLPGMRSIRLQSGNGASTAFQVTVPSGSAARVEVPTLFEAPNPVRSAFVWSGLGLLAAGSVTAIVGAITASGDATFQYQPGEMGSTLSQTSDGFEPVTLGLALATTGGLWAASALFIEEDSIPLWVGVGVGVLVGAGVFAVGTAF